MKILYIYDALCGWCYGFSPVMQQFFTQHQKDLEFEVISGGMVTGDRIGPIGEVAGYISTAYKDVEQATGVKFGEGFLQGILAEGTTIFSSIPPAIAMSLFQQLRPKDGVPFAGRLQRAIYHEGMPPTNLSAYGPLASEFDLDPVAFVDRMQEPQYAELAERDFQFTSALGIRGFPTVILIFGEEGAEKAVTLAQGYAPLDRLKAQYQKAAEMIAAGQL